MPRFASCSEVSSRCLSAAQPARRQRERGVGRRTTLGEVKSVGKGEWQHKAEPGKENADGEEMIDMGLCSRAQHRRKEQRGKTVRNEQQDPSKEAMFGDECKNRATQE